MAKTLIKCPDGQVKTAEEILKEAKHLPLPILRKLLPKTRLSVEREKPRFGVGRLVNECIRQAYYELTEDQVVPLERFWIFTRGHAIHDFFDFEKKEKWVSKEFEEFEAIGFVDGIEGDTLYELKTTSNVPEVPQDHHVLQAQGYYSMLPEEEKSKIKNICIVYFSLDKIKVFYVPYRDISELLRAKGVVLVSSLKTKTAPPRSIGWKCSYCNFKDVCQPNG